MTTFEEIVCCDCGTKFQMDSDLYELRQEDGEIFFCPNGHKQSFVDDEEVEQENTLYEANQNIIQLGKVIEDLKRELRQCKCEALRLRKPKWWNKFI